MKDNNILRYTLRVNRHLFKKFRYVAEYSGRSANKEIEQLMKFKVEEFEKKTVKLKSLMKIKSLEQPTNYPKK